jgi:hypothetical protein
MELGSSRALCCLRVDLSANDSRCDSYKGNADNNVNSRSLKMPQPFIQPLAFENGLND